MQSKCCGWLCVILFPSKPSEGRRGKASVSPRGSGCLRKKDCGTGSALVSLSQEIFMPSIIQSSFLEKHYWLLKPQKEWQLFKKQTNKKKTPTYYWEVKLFTWPRGIIMFGLSLSVTDATLKVVKHSANLCPGLLVLNTSSRHFFFSHAVSKMFHLEWLMQKCLFFFKD